MQLIAAVDRNWAIGFQNKLLVRIPADQRRFRENTIHGAVIMGRKTFESFPNGLPLKDRLNVVITSNPDYHGKDTVVVNSIEEALQAVRDYKTEDVFVIGGGSIYKQMLPFCDTALITKIDYTYMADTYLPNLDEMEGWELVEESEERTYYDLIYTYCRYERKAKQ